MRLIFSCILLLLSLFIFPTLQKESTIVLSNGLLRAPGEKVRLLPLVLSYETSTSTHWLLRVTSIQFLPNHTLRSRKYRNDHHCKLPVTVKQISPYQHLRKFTCIEDYVEYCILMLGCKARWLIRRESSGVLLTECVLLCFVLFFSADLLKLSLFLHINLFFNLPGNYKSSEVVRCSECLWLLSIHYWQVITASG